MLVALAILGMVGVADAKSTARANIRGVPHDFAVPDDWSAAPSADGIEFVPPPRRLSGPMSVAIVGVEKPSSQASADEVIRALADNDRKRKPYLENTKPEEIEFVGVKGTMIILAGKGPSGEVEAEMLVVAVTADMIYLFNCEGRLADIKAMVDDLAVIIGGVKPLASVSGGGTRPSGRIGRDLGAPVELDDPGLGLKLKGLKRWKLSIADDEYQLERTDDAPAAALSIRRVVVDNRKQYEKRAVAGARSRKVRFAGRDALVVERQAGDTVERDYHVFREGHVLVFGFRVVGRAGMEAVEDRIDEVEAALELAAEDATKRWDDGRTDFVTWGGVTVSTSADWKLVAVGPGRANFRSAAGVEVQVTARPWPAADDPYVTYGDDLKSRCGEDAYMKADAAVLGAAAAVRFRCAAKSSAETALVADGNAADGTRLYVRVVARHPKKKAVVPDAAIAEFTAYLALPQPAAAGR